MWKDCETRGEDDVSETYEGKKVGVDGTQEELGGKIQGQITEICVGWAVGDL